MSITVGDVVDLGRGLYAWPPPERSRGPANCGLPVPSRGARWADPPYDPFLAGQFLVESHERLPGAAGIDRVTVTHTTGDHLRGAGVLPGAETGAAREDRERLHHDPTPQRQHALVAGSDPSALLGARLARHFGAFCWSANEEARPTTCFTGELEVAPGECTVQVPSLPPAHDGRPDRLRAPRLPGCVGRRGPGRPRGRRVERRRADVTALRCGSRTRRRPAGRRPSPTTETR